jgi:hypothetical protein
MNEKTSQKTDDLLVVERVPKDQDTVDISLPNSCDSVHIWGALVSDKRNVVA